MGVGAVRQTGQDQPGGQFGLLLAESAAGAPAWNLPEGAGPEAGPQRPGEPSRRGLAGLAGP